MKCLWELNASINELPWSRLFLLNEIQFAPMYKCAMIALMYIPYIFTLGWIAEYACSCVCINYTNGYA